MSGTPERLEYVTAQPQAGFPVGLEPHIRAVKILLVVYLASLLGFWYLVVTRQSRHPLINVIAYVGMPAYLILIGECALVQQRLFKAGLYRYRGWQVVIGAIFLNPCALGWWIPASLLFSVARARERARGPS